MQPPQSHFPICGDRTLVAKRTNTCDTASNLWRTRREPGDSAGNDGR
jgi:hypothetical protein